MNDNLILIISILISAIIGGYLGMLISKLKSKSEQSTLEERNSNLQQQLDDLKFFNHTENEKQNENLNYVWELIRSSEDIEVPVNIVSTDKRTENIE